MAITSQLLLFSMVMKYWLFRLAYLVFAQIILINKPIFHTSKADYSLFHRSHLYTGGSRRHYAGRYYHDYIIALPAKLFVTQIWACGGIIVSRNGLQQRKARSAAFIIKRGNVSNTECAVIKRNACAASIRMPRKPVAFEIYLMRQYHSRRPPEIYMLVCINKREMRWYSSL